MLDICTYSHTASMGVHLLTACLQCAILYAIILYIGLLAAPDAVIIYAIYGDDSANRLEWTPPFTLDITDQDPDISGYTLCTNVTDVCYDLNSTNFDFPALCDSIKFTVTGINIVGKGSESTVTYTPQKESVKPEG